MWSHYEYKCWHYYSKAILFLQYYFYNKYKHSSKSKYTPKLFVIKTVLSNFYENFCNIYVPWIVCNRSLCLMVIFVDLPHCTYWFFEHHQFWKVNTFGLGTFAVFMNTGYVKSSLVNSYHLLCVLFMCVSDTKRRPMFSAQILLFTTVQYMTSIGASQFNNGCSHHWQWSMIRTSFSCFG